MPTTIPTQIEKCKGAMLASAIGDALGWPNEPRSKNRVKKPKVNDFFVEWTRSCKEPRWHDERILPGEYSDDTQMTLSVARSIIAGNWEKYFAEKELPFWLKYERGGGGALLKAAWSINDKKVLLWQSAYTKDYFNAGGNGAAMRILPHVIASANKPDLTVLMLDVIKDTLITHGHPRAFLGATCYAFALDYLLRKNTVLEYGELVSAVIDGQQYWAAFPDDNALGNWLGNANQYADFDYVKEWEKNRSNMFRQLEFIKVSLKKGLMLDDTKILNDLECFGSVNGAGDVAALASIYLASKYANNPVLGIKIPAFSFGADTDTIASITGGLLGMLSGTNWIPTEWKAVQDYDCLVRTVELLLSDDKKAATKAVVSTANAQDNGWMASPIGKLRFIDAKEYPNGKHGFVVIKRWRTALEQTIYIKEFQPIDMRSFQPNHDGGQQMQIPQQPILCDLFTTQQQPLTPVQAQGPKSVQETVPQTDTLQKAKSQFVMDNIDINTLLCDPNFKDRITIGTVLKIIQAFIEGKNNSEAIAKQFKVEQTMVDVLKPYIKPCR